MVVGVPREIKTDENRVAITPAGVNAFVASGHQVVIEEGAGAGSRIADQENKAAGAIIVSKAEEVWERSDLILKVKEPLESEIPLLRENQVLFTYLHLAANSELTSALMKRKVIAVAYETVQLPDGSLPLLTPMSEVAGRLSIQVGAFCLEAKNGGTGILLPGVSGVPPAKVVILGAGVSGSNACYVAVGIGARVTILDVNPARLSYVHDVMQGHVTTIMSNAANIEEYVAGADLVIGAVLIPGAKAPKLIPRDLVRKMKPGSAIVDISVDQGGCCETTRPTTHRDPTYISEEIVHYCVANMPGAVPQTSTYALTNVTLSYALEIANKGYETAVRDNAALRKGLNIADGQITCRAVAQAFDMEWEEY